MERKKAILLKINGELKEIGAPVVPEDDVQEVFANAPEALAVYRHSCAHLLAQAVLELFPDAQYGVGPAVENGFYYDFLLASPFVENDLE
ncbi:MAG: threonine--tRNA ligase, partial [Candidatus Aminicenantes bacterium]|nr:threonine--tRNA ligase [Candidatus Aminicenantes bacterium]